MSDDDIDDCLSRKSRAAVADGLMHLVREACVKSSLHNYNGSLYCFDGRIYGNVDFFTFSNVVYDVLKKKGLPDGLFNRLPYMVKVCRGAVMDKELSPDPAVVVFDNCVYDMDGHVSRRFNPRWVAVTKMDYGYDPEMPCTRWQWFLDDVLPRESHQRILQEFLGCIFINRRKVKIEKMMVLLGSGANGKSVVAEVVKSLLGKENVSPFGLRELISGNDLKKNISFINGKRLNYSSEISAQQFVSESDALKKLVSGEPIVGRDNYQSNFVAYDIPLIMANANQLPAMKKDESSAISRRFIILPFDVTIPPERQNPRLAEELKEELPGIFNWVIEGRDRFIANGFEFTDIKEIEDSVTEYRIESSTVMEFMIKNKYFSRYPESHVEPRWVLSTTLFNEYSKWCYANGKPAEDIEKQNAFARILHGAGYRRKPSGDGNVYGIYCDNLPMSLNYEREKKKTAVRRVEDNKPFFDKDGVKWVRSRDGIAKALGLKEHEIQSALKDKVLMGCVRKDGNTNVFNIEKCRERMMEYLQGGKADILARRKRREIGIRRSRFNQRMIEIGEPYRKYTERYMSSTEIPEDIIIVPDEWDYEKEIARKEQSSLIKRRRIRTEELNLESLASGDDDNFENLTPDSYEEEDY